MKLSFGNITFKAAALKDYNIRKQGIKLNSENDSFIKQKSISFKQKPRPIYIITQEGKYTKYDTLNDAAKEIGLTNQALSAGIKNKSITANKYIIVLPEEIEEYNQDGELIISREKIDNIISRFEKKKNIKPKGPQKAVYAITREGNYKRFNNKTDASQILNISAEGIAACINHKAYTAGGYVFVNADEVEIQGEAECIPDEEKIKELSKIFEKKYTKREHPKVFYSIDFNGNYKKFHDKEEAAKEYGVMQSGISSCLRHKSYTCGGYIFVKAEEIEKTDKSGNTEVDENKVNELIEAANENSKICRIYAIDKTGKYIKFPSISTAAEELNVSNNIISMHLSNQIQNPFKYAFVRANDVEIKNKDGTTQLDTEKLEEIKQRITVPERSNRVKLYAVDAQGNYKYYKSIQDAADDIGINRTSVYQCLNGLACTANGYVIIPADKAETENENGEIITDENKIKELNKSIRLFSQRKSTPVYKITKEGKFKRYNSIKQAERENNLCQSVILRSINKRMPLNSIAFIPASEVDTYDENGNYITQKEILKNYYKNIFGEFNRKE